MRLAAETVSEVKTLIRELMGDKIEEYKAEAKNDSLIQAITAMRPAPQPRKEEKGVKAGRFLRAIAGGRNADGAAKFARDNWNDAEMTKALEASVTTAGGVLVPTEFSTDIIELLAERAIFRSMNPVILPMMTGSMTIPKITGGATASYIGESQNLPKTEQAFGQVAFQWKKLAALVPMSNDLLRFETVGADTMVRDDVVAAIAWAEDNAFLRNMGTQFAPKGIRYFATSGNVVAMTATPTLTKVTVDLASAVLRLRNANVRMIRPGWLMAPRTAMGLRTIRDTNGNLVFAGEMATGRLFGIPFGESNVVPINLGGGSNESEIYLADFADIIIGEANSLEVSASDIATYHDGSALQSAFSLDQTVLKALVHHDLGVRHEESITVITGVTWAPGTP
jgi:HK97 family phage major capsid protein